MTKPYQLLTFLSRLNYLERNIEGKYEIKVDDALIKPIKSNWYNNGLKNLKIKTSCRILPSLGTGKDTMVHNTTLDLSEPTTSYYSFSKYTGNYDRNSYKDKEALNNLLFKYSDGYALTSRMGSTKIKVHVTEKEINHSEEYSISTVYKMFDRRYKLLYKYMKQLNESKKIKMIHDSENIFIHKDKSCFLYIDESKAKLFEDIFLVVKDRIKQVKVTKSFDFDGFDMIDVLANYFGLTKSVTKKHTIYNGWGSYTYTYIHKAIDLDTKLDYTDLMYILFYVKHNFKVNFNIKNFDLNESVRCFGMVQTSGGYTHVS